MMTETERFLKEHHPGSPLALAWELFYTVNDAPAEEEQAFITHCEKQNW